MNLRFGNSLIVIFLKFIIFVRGSHCDYLPGATKKNLAVPLTEKGGGSTLQQSREFQFCSQYIQYDFCALFTGLYEELSGLCSSPAITRETVSGEERLAWCVARIPEKTNTCRLLVRKQEEQSPLRRPRCRWEDMKMELKSRMGARGLDLHFLRQAQLAGCCEKRIMRFWVP